MTKNNKFLTIVLLTMLFVLPATFVRADNDNDDDRGRDSRAEFKSDSRLGGFSPMSMWGNGKNEDFKEKQKEMKEEMEKRKDEWDKAKDDWQKSKPEDRQEKRRELAGLFFGRFNFAHQGLQGFHDRIENWANAMVEKYDINDDEAKSALDDAQEKIDLIKEKSTKIKEILESDISDDEKEAKREEVKALLEEIKPLAKDAHELLKTAFSSIKDEVKKVWDARIDDDSDNEEEDKSGDDN